MALRIELPSLAQQHAFNLTRVAELWEDAEFQAFEGKIETDRFGDVIMHPPAAFGHGSTAGEIVYQLRHRLGPNAQSELGISTSDGVKAVDAAWCSPERFEINRGKIVATLAPEIVVEVMSPSNRPAQMDYRRALLFDAGAEEFWLCELNGTMRFYHRKQPDEVMVRSVRCPDFPPRIQR